VKSQAEGARSWITVWYALILREPDAARSGDRTLEGSQHAAAVNDKPFGTPAHNLPANCHAGVRLQLRIRQAPRENPHPLAIRELDAQQVVRP